MRVIARVVPVLFAIVELAQAESVSSGTEPRIYAASRQTWVWAEPSKKSRRLGSLRAGTGVRRSPEPSKLSPDCPGGFYAVEPRGFVCDDDDATLDAGDRYVRAMRLCQPEPGAHPFRYAISNGAPMYQRLPAPEEWARAERDLGKAGTYKKYPWNERHERLAEERAIAPAQSVPFFLEDGGSVRAPREKTLVRRLIPLGSMVAYTRAFEHAGRTWLLSTDGTVVPADRVRPYRRSAFRGVVFERGVAPPIAFVRDEASAPYHQDTQRFVASSEKSSKRRWWPLEDPRAAVTTPGGRYLATRQRDRAGRALWVRDTDVTVVRAEHHPPAGIGERDKWLVVSVTRKTLVAYEGARPVFATLVSPGTGGISQPERNPVKASTTPRGNYRLQYKYFTQTMSPEKSKPEDSRTFFISEVPYAQYFQIPFAFHTAYWHEDFGEWMSGGCVNLSPSDGEWLFRWTEPALPEGWDTVWAGGPNGKGTRVIVTR